MLGRDHLLCLGLGAAAGALALVAIRRLRTRSPRTPRPRGAHTVTRKLGGSDVSITVLGMGGASLGDLYTQISDADAAAALLAAHANGVTFFDTAPWYGVGLSEVRFGLTLHRLPRDSFVLNTKVGRTLTPDPTKSGASHGWIGGFRHDIRFSYEAAALEAQIGDSLQRIGVGRLDTVVIHDLEPNGCGWKAADPAAALAVTRRHLEELRRSGFGALERMRTNGTIRAFGAGVNIDENGEDAAAKRAWNREYVSALLTMHKAGGRPIDFFLFANLHSLLTHDAFDQGLLDDCHRAGVSIVVGGPFSSGILATGADPPNGTPMYNYKPASAEVRARTRAIQSACARHGVPLIAAALQFPLLHPAVASVIPGGKSPEEVRSNVELLNHPIPPKLWSELKAEGLLPSAMPTPG